MKNKIVPFLLALLGYIVVLSSCSLFGGGKDEKKIAVYLNTVGPDFQKSRDDLKAFDQEFGDDIDSLAIVLNMVKESKNDFEGMMADAKNQEVPENPQDIKLFHDSLMQYYTDSVKLLNDYEQILVYAQDLYKSAKPLEQVMASSQNASSIYEVADMLMSLKSSIDECIAIAENSSPPAYMADCHANYLNVLKRFSSATDDFIYALQLTDPLRINATTYRYELLSNKLIYIGDDMAREIEGQQKKMSEMGENLKKTQDALYKQLLIWQGQYKTAS